MPLAVQPITSGVGPEFHRVFSILIPCLEKFAMQAMRTLKADLNSCFPQTVLVAKKTSGAPGAMAVGDEFELKYFFGARAPLRIQRVEESRFVLAALTGNLEAGEVQISLKRGAKKKIRLEVEIHARSRNRLVDLIYDKIPVARIVQAILWTEFCENFARLAANLSGEPPREFNVHSMTERRHPDGDWQVLNRD